MPWTLPSSPSRRSLLAGLAGSAGAALLTGCSGGDSRGAGAAVPPERQMREAAVRDSARLLERYDATTAAHPALAQRLAPLRTAVAAHVTALAGPEPAPGSFSGSPSATPSGVTPAGVPAPVPAGEADALTALADAERSLSETRTVELAGAPGELARLLASVAACGAVHTYLLTSTPGATS
ncbi:hypothetical protein ACFWUZ_26095 [Streptomyces sp. NPDC058646]|uniref:hypothetical protein n=1 Tax=Streptomyces sp. NPDC058646 TaxID=3346574 RepID=UPI0036642AE7